MLGDIARWVFALALAALAMGAVLADAARAGAPAAEITTTR